MLFLRPYILSIRCKFCDVKTLMGLKFVIEFGSSQKKMKSEFVHDFFIFTYKVSIPMGIRRFSYIFRKIYSISRVSEPES